MTTKTTVIAIDGPSGAGKGTVARAVADALGWSHVDTGAMYRAVAWLALHRGCAMDDEAQVAAVAGEAEFRIEIDRIIIDGHDVTALIRTPEMDAAAAMVARMPRVREALVARQRGYVARGPVVMEGRDIGTVVFPDAGVKIYLDATPRGACGTSGPGPRPPVVTGLGDRCGGRCSRGPRPVGPNPSDLAPHPSR